jgi:hypothetical protein
MLTKLLQQRTYMKWNLALELYQVVVAQRDGVRASDLFHKNDVELNVLQEYFDYCYGKVSTSGYEF